MKTFLLNKVSRKAILASFLLASSAFASTVMAQTQDGRDFSIDGFAAYEGTPGTNWYRAGGTTGGAGGKVVKANTFSELQAYLQAEDPYVVIVDHDISTGIKCYVDGINTGKLLDDQSGASGVETTYGERILVASNKTLIGVVDPATGKAPLFTHITFVMQCVDNIIIRNCRFTMKGVPVLKTGENKIVALRNGAQVEVGDPDCIGIQADKTSAKTDWGGHIWIDHCEFFNGGAATRIAMTVCSIARTMCSGSLSAIITSTTMTRVACGERVIATCLTTAVPFLSIIISSIISKVLAFLFSVAVTYIIIITI